MPTINEAIVAQSDNGYSQYLDGSTGTAGFNTYSSYLFGMYKSNAYGIGLKPRKTVGLRFQGLAIPQGATIDLATLTVFGVGSAIGTPDFKIHGHDTDDAAAFGGGNKVITAPKTTASRTLQVPAGPANSVNDVTAIVQEVVDRGGWVSGNDLAFGVFPNNVSGSHTWYGSAYSKGNPATLDIDYTESSGGVTINVPAGSLTLTGQALLAKLHLRQAVPAGSLTLTGIALISNVNVRQAIPAGSLSLTGLVPTATYTQNLAVPAASLELAVQALTLSLRGMLPAGTLELAAQTPTVAQSFELEVPAAALSLTGIAPALTSSIAVALAELAITAEALSVSQARLVEVPAGALTLTAETLTLADALSGLEAATLTLTGLAPLPTFVVFADVGSLTLTAETPISVATTTAHTPELELRLQLYTPIIVLPFYVEQAPVKTFGGTELTGQASSYVEIQPSKSWSGNEIGD